MIPLKVFFKIYITKIYVIDIFFFFKLCKKNLEGQSFFVKSGKPFCKGHATRMWSVYMKIRNLLFHECPLNIGSNEIHQIIIFCWFCSVALKCTFPNCFCLKKYKYYDITWMYLSVKPSSQCQLYYIYIST